MSHEYRRSQKEQLSALAHNLPRAAFVTAIALFSMAILFGSVLYGSGVFEFISTLVGDVQFAPYIVSSWVGVTLYLTARSMDPEVVDSDTDVDEAAEDAVEVDSNNLLEEAKQSAEQVFENLAMMAYISLLIGVAAALSAHVTTHYAPTFGVLIAVFLPAVERRVARSPFWFLSPSTLLAFPAALAVLPVTVVGVGVTIALQGVVELSQTLKRACKYLVKRLVRVFQMSNIDNPALDSFQRTFNPRSRR